MSNLPIHLWIARLHLHVQQYTRTEYLENSEQLPKNTTNYNYSLFNAILKKTELIYKAFLKVTFTAKTFVLKLSTKTVS